MAQQVLLTIGQHHPAQLLVRITAHGLGKARPGYSRIDVQGRGDPRPDAASVESVVLLYGLEDIPGTDESDREADEIAAPELLWLAPLGCDEEAPAQYVAGLATVVAPGEAPDLLLPDRPGVYMKDVQLGGGGFVLAKDVDIRHWAFPGALAYS